MIENADLQKVLKTVVDARRVPARPVWISEQARQNVVAVAGLQKVLKTVVDARRVPARPVWDTETMRQSMAAVVGILETAVVAPRNMATDGDLGRISIAIPGKTPLFPGLVDPWQQIRDWELKDWLIFFDDDHDLARGAAVARSAGGHTRGR